MSSSSSKSNDNTFREAIDWAIDSMTTIDTPPILSDPQKQKLINAIGKKTDPGGSTHNIKQYLSNLPLNEDLRNNIENLSSNTNIEYIYLLVAFMILGIKKLLKYVWWLA